MALETSISHYFHLALRLPSDLKFLSRHNFLILLETRVLSFSPSPFFVSITREIKILCEYLFQLCVSLYMQKKTSRFRYCDLFQLIFRHTSVSVNIELT